MIKLVLKLKETQIDEFNLEKSMINIGRSQENDIVIDNIAVSRRHAQMEIKEGKGYVLRDLGSSNGTFLNGVQIDANDHELADGDVIGIAKFDILVKGLTQPSKEAPKVPSQGDNEGTLVYEPFESPRRKPTPEPGPSPKKRPPTGLLSRPLKGPPKEKSSK
jgi:pSer/pThr/pTyr-binding forkhead associated (FHA) protein